MQRRSTNRPRLDQRRAELAGDIPTSPFAGLEGAFCRFSRALDVDGEPEEVCEGTYGTFVYFDVDRQQLFQYPMDLDMLGAAACGKVSTERDDGFFCLQRYDRGHA
jgi:hypothetical protein